MTFIPCGMLESWMTIHVHWRRLSICKHPQDNLLIRHNYAVVDIDIGSLAHMRYCLSLVLVSHSLTMFHVLFVKWCAVVKLARDARDATFFYTVYVGANWTVADLLSNQSLIHTLRPLGASSWWYKLFSVFSRLNCTSVVCEFLQLVIQSNNHSGMIAKSSVVLIW